VIEVFVPMPTEYATLGNYPNPFNPTTNIAFRLPETSDVSIQIYGIQGNLVRELALNQSFEAGDHFVSWDATDNNGQQVASGMYVYLFTAGNYKKTEKMLLLK
jgi:flagellar hook assembly protein FlgD